MLYETRGFEFLHAPTKTVQLLQYQRVWREIWTDGRSLPADVGGDGPTSLDPHWFGYSVGRWADDYTFVVETNGTRQEKTSVDYSVARTVPLHTSRSGIVDLDQATRSRSR